MGYYNAESAGSFRGIFSWAAAASKGRARIAVIFLAVTCASAPDAPAAYPERPIRYIVPAAAGGAPDILARTFATELTKQMGQQVVVDNRPGASGSIAMEMLAKATPNGYTMAAGNILTLALNRSVLPKLPYDPDKDLQAVAQTSFVVNLLAVTPSLPVKSVRELVDYGKRNPDKVIALHHVREKVAAFGAELVGGTPEQFAEHIRKETAKWADVVKRAGVKVD